MVRGLECRSPREPEKRKMWYTCLVKLFGTVPYLTASNHSWVCSESAFTVDCPVLIMPLLCKG